jgi:LmbE family N-acetylglucosaminyl deacetylase
MLRLAADPRNRIVWVVFASNPDRAAEAQASARSFLGEGANREFLVHDFRDGFLPWNGAEVKERFEELKARVDPDVVFTHHRDDLHQDHRLVCELTWNTFRDHLVFEYEIPKWDGDLGRPNAYLELSDAEIEQKIEKLLSAYASQRQKPWFKPEVFRALATLRGMECRSGSGVAEAFHASKLNFTL